MRHVANIPYSPGQNHAAGLEWQVPAQAGAGPLEQTYKVAELDLSGIVPPDAEILQLLDDEFITVAVARFQLMRDDLHAAAARHDLR
ncbi:MAG: hypothetical protein WKG07_07040 [Hymenobacter sp.]